MALKVKMFFARFSIVRFRRFFVRNIFFSISSHICLRRSSRLEHSGQPYEDASRMAAGETMLLGW